MARSALLIWFSIFVWSALPAFAQASDQDAWRKPEQLIRALELKRSDVVAVMEPEAFLAPLISNRGRELVNINGAPDHSVDVIVLYDVLHAVDRRPEFCAKLRRVLRYGGRIVNIDFSADPPSAPPVKSKLTEPQVVDEFEAAGFRISQSVTLLPYQYFQVFE
jgi:SAM-dependent methyltransferase